jgi:hypothetical protein
MHSAGRIETLIRDGPGDATIHWNKADIKLTLGMGETSNRGFKEISDFLGQTHAVCTEF